MRIAVVANVHAARHRRDPSLADAYAHVGRSVDVHVSRTLVELDGICARIAAQPPALVAISGGDGTISLTTSALRRAFGGAPLPPILPLAAGTMNMVAHSVGVRMQPLKELRAAAGLWARLQHVERDTMVVEGRTGFIFGTGLVTNFLEVYYEGDELGPKRAAVVTGQALAAIVKRGPRFTQLFRRQSGTLTLDDGEPVTADWTAILVQTIENLGIGFRPAYQALQEPGTCHVIATHMSAVQLGNHLAYIFRGRPWPPGPTIDRLARTLSFAPAGAEWTYTLDGELYRSAATVKVEVGLPLAFVRAA